MNLMAILLVPVLLLGDGETLECEGMYALAGMSYEEDGDIAGQVRILSRFLEESLYAGESRHAFMLIQTLEAYPLETGYIDFWWARLAWVMGLPDLACRKLEDIGGGNEWLSSRASGIADQYRGAPDEAMEHHLAAWENAGSERERFYSALDMAFTLIQTGDHQQAELISTRLAVSFPNDGLPLISLALAMEGQERFGTAMTILQELASNPSSAGIMRSMAAVLLEEMI